MVYAYISKTSLHSEWFIEEIVAECLTEANAKYKNLRKKYPTHAVTTLVGGPSLEAIKKAYNGKIY